MKIYKQSVAVPLATALMFLAATPAVLAFGGFRGSDVPEEARETLKACHNSILEKYDIEVPEASENSRRFRGWGCGFSADLNSEERATMRGELQSCRSDVMEQYGIEAPKRQDFKSFGMRVPHDFRGEFFGGLKDLFEEDKTALMQEIEALIEKYRNK